MKAPSLRLLASFASASVLVGCGGSQASYVGTDTTLGKVVIYRNGVAYFERYAEPRDGKLTISVPEDKVDDFLKSLSVVDVRTGEPAPVSYPAGPASGSVEMKVAPGKPGQKLRLSYLTGAPAWKASYRVVVGKAGQVDLQGWAIVDNTSGEDWTSVKLGVGSSSAMSFHFNLKTPLLVDCETLRATDQFAVAPTAGGATHGTPAKRVFGELDDEALAQADSALDGARPVTVSSEGGRNKLARPAPGPPSTVAIDATSKGTASKPGGSRSAAAPEPHTLFNRSAERAVVYSPARPSMPSRPQLALGRPSTRPLSTSLRSRDRPRAQGLVRP
jgi:hypothetical protein